jgi:hypothetical protein
MGARACHGLSLFTLAGLTLMLTHDMVGIDLGVPTSTTEESVPSKAW